MVAGDRVGGTPVRSGRALLEWGGFGGVGGQAQRLLAGEAALRGPVELA